MPFYRSPGYRAGHSFRASSVFEAARIVGAKLARTRVARLVDVRLTEVLAGTGVEPTWAVFHADIVRNHGKGTSSAVTFTVEAEEHEHDG